MDKEALIDKLKEAEMMADSAARTAAGDGMSYPTQINIAAKVVAAELGRKGWGPLEGAARAAITAHRYGAALADCVAAAARAATLNVVTSRASVVAKVVVVEGWNCQQFMELCNEVGISC